MMHVSFAPLLALSFSIVLVAGLCAVCAISFYKSNRGRWYRLLASLVVALTLFDPQLVMEEREAVSDTAVIVVDRSSSQQLGLRKAQTDAALSTLLEKLKALPRLDIRVHEVNDAGNDGTLLFQALDQNLRDLPSERVAGAFFITDGQVHDVPQRADRLALKAPLHVLITGHEK